MYSEQFDLLSPAFSQASDSDFFESKQHLAALNALRQAIYGKRPLILFTAPPDAGKTVLYQQLKNQTDDNFIWAFHCSEDIEETGLLQIIQESLHITHPDAYAPLRQLEKRLRPLRLAGRQFVLLIDNAQQLSDASLQLLYQLSGLTINGRYVLQFVLFAREEFTKRLKATHFRPLYQQINPHLRLQPIGTEEATAYLSFRSSRMGYSTEKQFTQGMATMIAKAAHGLLGKMNRIADKTLMTAAAEQSSLLNIAHVVTAIREVRAENSIPNHKLRLALALILIFLCIGVSIWNFLPSQKYPATQMHQHQARQTKSIANIEQAVEPFAISEAQGTLIGAAAYLPTVVDLSALHPILAQNEIKLPQEFGPIAQDLFKTKRLNPARSQSEQWCLVLRSTPVSIASRLDVFLKNAKWSLDFNQIWLYLKENDPLSTVLVIYGNYPDQDAALTAKARLPAWIRDRGVYAQNYATLLQPTPDTSQSPPQVIPEQLPRNS